MDNLPELRDIHIPRDVSVFPLAYGWWVILAIIIVLPLIIKLWQILRKRSKKLYALRLLNNLSDTDVIVSAIKISEILRRICIYKYPEAVNIFSVKWLDFLNNHAVHKISGKSAELLINAPYIDKKSVNYNTKDLHKLVEFCKKWIGENL